MQRPSSQHLRIEVSAWPSLIHAQNESSHEEASYESGVHIDTFSLVGEGGWPGVQVRVDHIFQNE